MYRLTKPLLFVFAVLQIGQAPSQAQQNDLKTTAAAEQFLSTRGEVIFWFVKPDQLTLSDISINLSIDKVSGDTITVYANRQGFQWFKEQNIPFGLIVPPSLKAGIFNRKSEIPSDWQFRYPSYTEYIELMEQFAAEYPSICSLVDFGTTPGGHKLLAVKITDNPGEEEKEPVVFYTASIHGDEPLGFVLMLRLIDQLLSGYTNDNYIQNLVNGIEIWINPLFNPDGAYFISDTSISGAVRFNSNQVDLNRDFPDINRPLEEQVVRQSETMDMINFMKEIKPTLAANFHGGAEVVNYPWDTWYTLHADDSWYRYISRCYADTVHAHSVAGYMTYLENGITNGNEWYAVYGGRQDYVNYALHGREVTIELSDEKIPAENTLDDYWNYNRKSLVQYIQQALTGICGTITDSLTGLPLKAQVRILNHDKDNSFVYSDEETGSFYRLNSQGEYNLAFAAPGYKIRYVPAQIIQNELTLLDIQLTSSIELEVYPNPFTDHLYFTIPYAGYNLQVRFVDMAGKVVKYLNKTITTPGLKEIRMNDLPQGMYIVHIFYNNQSWKYKVLKNKQ
jgi:hypothetical protein